MIVDVHTHYFRPELDFGPNLLADMERCGVDPALWGDVGERHLETTRAAAVLAGRAQARAGDRLVISDALIAATARVHGATILTNDPSLYPAHGVRCRQLPAR